MSTKTTDASGNVYENWTDPSGATITALRPPVVLWSSGASVVNAASVAVNTNLVLTAAVQDYDGAARTDVNAPNFALDMRSPAGDVDRVPVAIAAGAGTLTINFAVPGDYELHVAPGSGALLMRHLVITVTGPRQPIPLKGVGVSKDATTGVVSVTRNSDDVGQFLQNALANYLAGTALTTKEQQGLLLAIAQRLNIIT